MSVTHHTTNGTYSFFAVEIPEGTPPMEGVGKAGDAVTIVVLDRSGSMGTQVERMTNRIFPEVLRSLGAEEDEEVILITFDSQIATYWTTVAGLRTMDIYRRGRTYMEGVAAALREVTDKLRARPIPPPVRLLGLSDGMLNDGPSALAAMTAVTEAVKKDLNIVARGVRLQTSSRGSPSTTALASLLQMSTGTPASLVTILASTNDTSMIEALADMFAYVELRAAAHMIITPGAEVLCNEPWSEPRDSLHVPEGNTVVWLRELPKIVLINGKRVEVKTGMQVTHDTLDKLLGDTLEYYVNQVRLLKVTNTTQSRESMERIVAFFRDFESTFAEPDVDLTGADVVTRMTAVRRRTAARLSSIVNTLEQIANDDRVAALNAQQQADWLTKADTTRNSKALARRAAAAAEQGDPGQAMRDEIHAMRTHLGDLDEVDGDDAVVSFVGHGSTYDNIMALCSMADDKDFDEYTVADMMLIFGPVGIPCQGPIGEFPDPMAWRVERLMPEASISLPDVLAAHPQKVKTPGTNHEIVNVVPIFEDERVQRFLQKYAPRSLDMVCGIGMRRMIAEVPKTYPYTIAAGLWKMVEMLDTDKSELNVMTFSGLLRTYQTAIGGYFNFLTPLLIDAQDPETSFNIGHNGITNMLSPLLKLLREGELDNLPRILRALYSYEMCMAMRRILRSVEPDEVEGMRKEKLYALLGIDLEAHATALPEKFERLDAPVFHSEWELDGAVLEELTREGWYIKYCTLIVPFFRAVIGEKIVDAVRRLPTVTDATAAEALGLGGLEYNEFMAANVVAGLLFNTKQSRVDKETEKPTLPDFGTMEGIQRTVGEYVKEQYRADYARRLAELEGEEKRLLLDELIARLVAMEKIAPFCELLRTGVENGPVKVQIVNSNSYGFTELYRALMDPAVPNFARKIWVLFSGRNFAPDGEGKVVWNAGNPLRVDRDELRELLKAQKKGKLLEEIEALYCGKVVHTYRDSPPNRQGHSNEKPSYYAFGFQTLADFHREATADQWADYIAAHKNCCGVRAFLAAMSASHVKRA